MKDNLFQTLEPAIRGNPNLRTPQLEAFDSVVDLACDSEDQQREVEVILPVGCGKSGCITLSPFAFQSTRTLVVAPNVKIAEQLYRDFNPSNHDAFYRGCQILKGATFPEPVRIQGRTSNRTDFEEADLVVTNTQQLQGPENRWLEDLPDDFFDLILFDEGHQPLILEQLREDYHWRVAAYSESGLGHGRIERRTIQVSPELDQEVPWVAFPGVRYAARLVREVIYKKTGEVRSTGVVYLLTSLPAELATPENLLRWSRLYWTIENRVHYVRDAALREDACRVRKGSLPRVMAAFANLAISVLRLLGQRNLKRAMSNFKLRPNTAVAVVWLAAAGACGP